MEIDIEYRGRPVEIGPLIGRGRLGEVYAALSGGEDLAVKVYTRYQSAPIEVADALRRSTLAGQALANMPQGDLRVAPGLMAVVVHSKVQEWPGVLMRRAEGVASGDWLKQNPSRDEKSDMLRQLLMGIALMHDCNVFHNDISFGNLLRGDALWLLDFDRAGDAPPPLLADSLFYEKTGYGAAHDLRAFAILATLVTEGYHPFTDDISGLLRGVSGFGPMVRPAKNAGWARLLEPALGLEPGLCAQSLLDQWPCPNH